MNSTELRAKAQRIAHEARAKLTEAETDGANVAEIEATFDRMMADADALEARAAKLDKVDAFTSAYEAADERRERTERKIETGEKLTAEERQTAAVLNYLRTGDRTECRAQSVGTASEGGYLVPTTLANQLIVSMKAFGPMNDDSVVTYLRTAKGERINHPTMNDTANEGAWIDENTQVSTDSVATGTKPLEAYKLTSNAFLVSSELLTDAAFDVNAIINGAIAERMARALNKRATTGTGSDQINGLATAAANGKTAALANAVTSDEVLDLIHSVDPAYRLNAALMFNDSTLLAVRKLKDGEGRYIWQPSVVAGQAPTLHGHRYFINPDMASIGAGNKAILFGDFKRYTVRQAGGFEIKRLVERYADYDQVGFIGFARFDGELLDSAAVKALTLAAS